MSFLQNLTMFDYIVLIISLLFLVRGVWIGFMRQLAVFFALIGGYWLACRYSALLIPSVGQLIENPRIIFLLSFSILFLVSAVLFILFGKALHKVMEVSMLGWFNRMLGFFLGGFKAFIFASLLFLIVTPTLSASNDMLRKSVSTPFLKDGAAFAQKIIFDERIRKSFNPKTSAIPAIKEVGEQAAVFVEEVIEDVQEAVEDSQKE